MWRSTLPSLSLILILYFLDQYAAFLSGTATVRPKHHSTMMSEKVDKPIIKLPIVQIIEKNEMKGEFICGNNLKDCLLKLQATLGAIDKSNEVSGAGDFYTENMYTDDMLNDAISGSDGDTRTVILKIYRTGCKKCAKLDPIFATYPTTFKNNFRWIQAESTDIPGYITLTKSRLLGVTDKSQMSDCTSCINAGSVICSECVGVGYVQRGELAVTCPTCCGSKKVRCPTCGGKCLKCSSD